MRISGLKDSAASAQFQMMTKVGVNGNLKNFPAFFSKNQESSNLYSGWIAAVKPPIQFIAQGTQEINVVEFY